MAGGTAGLVYIRVKEGGQIEAAKPVMEGLSAEQQAAVVQQLQVGAGKRAGLPGLLPRLRAVAAARSSATPPSACPPRQTWAAQAPIPPPPPPQPTPPQPTHTIVYSTLPHTCFPPPLLGPLQGEPGDLLLLAAGPAGKVNRALDRVRLYLGKDLGLVQVGRWLLGRGAGLRGAGTRSRRRVPLCTSGRKAGDHAPLRAGNPWHRPAVGDVPAPVAPLPGCLDCHIAQLAPAQRAC